MRPNAGTVLGNRYELSSRIAVGGMGEVWRGRDTVLGREIAAKIMKEEYLSDQTFLDRFRAEARSMGAVSDPGIAGVYDYGEENGSPYLVMEYVPGEALSAILDRNGQMPERDVLEVVAQSAQALHAAHRAGVVHRDIKPGNLLITPEFRVKITDFGIARVADQAPLTKTGQVMGTAQYLAPEQATGKGSTPKSDLYSLGIIMYEGLAGVRPFTGESQVEIAIAQVNRRHPPLPNTVSEPVRRLVDALLAKSPDGRPADGQALATASRALLAGDVAGAEAAVPQMLGASTAGEAVTRVMSQPTESTTRVLPVAGAAAAGGALGAAAYAAQPAGAAHASGAAGGYGSGTGGALSMDSDAPDDIELEEPVEKSSKGPVIAVSVLIVLALAGLGWILWLFFGPQGEPEPLDTGTPTPSETVQAIRIDPDDYIGLSESTARSNLESLDLVVDTVTVASEKTSGTVTDVRRGAQGYEFRPGDTVVLEISGGPAQTQEPEATQEPTQTPTAPSPQPTTQPPQQPEPTQEPDPTQEPTQEPEPEPSDPGDEDEAEPGNGLGS